jgi:hypothetical protein
MTRCPSCGQEVDLKLCTVFVVYKNEQPAAAVSSSHAAQQ